ncbi:hypothetical protein HYH03_010082 [Edaphochlamys debaryana]|uniref:Uncharacterized protein n=1 Tax=Edaphochlamys debaryana TaxID=47281 RepID=A0A835XX60_9CHLO|nr:hypothetical protein HYH03_010082 [Edaphochlamys debaryana]|eukprot:KAG2491505.1 hypothetical protein HYH03_010082 [Edaphochlamys debaryana]
MRIRRGPPWASSASCAGTWRNIETLELDSPLAEDSVEWQMGRLALAQLRKLKHLTLTDYAWLRELDKAVASGLESLTVAPNYHRTAPIADELPEIIASMTSLKTLTLSGEVEEDFSPETVLQLMDAAPTSLERMTLRHVEAAEGVEVIVICQFSDGLLTSFKVESPYGEEPFTPHELSAFLAQALLPSRMLGPRLPLLDLDTQLSISDNDDDGGAAAGAMGALLARCDEVKLGTLGLAQGWSVEVALEAVRRYGLPGCIYHGATAWAGVCFQHKLPPPAADPGPAPPPVPPPLPLAAVVERVVQRVAGSASDPESQSRHLLVRGPGMRALLSAHTVLRAWIGQVAELIEESSPVLEHPCDNPCYVRRYRALPSAGALVLECWDGPSAQAGVRAARELLGLRPGGEEEGDEVCGAVEVLRTHRSAEMAFDKVLQALWDGAEEGGPGPATGSREGELARLRWLLETWEGLDRLPLEVVLEAGD